jgi:Fe-coproporphyrin III synthase
LPHATPLRQLPLVTLLLTERCNSRCVSCDYWRHGREDISLAQVEKLLPSFKQLGTRIAVVSGGEPLLHPQWMPIAEALRGAGLQLWLLSSGLSLAKHARAVGRLFQTVTVSLDGVDRPTYTAIRGLDAFDKVIEGIRALTRAGVPVSLRVTLQRANYRQLSQFISLALELNVRQISFLAVDVANPHAFGRSDEYAQDLALRAEDLPIFEQAISALSRERAEEFSRGFIAESPAKLYRLFEYFAAVQGQGHYPAVRCNAPEFSAVIGATGRVQPCFFIDAPAEWAQLQLYGHDLHGLLNGAPMSGLRAAVRAGERAECKTCVCSLWRDLEHLDDTLALPKALALAV